MSSSRLTRLERTLPSHHYFDFEHYQRELEALWYRGWQIVGRTDSLKVPGEYQVIDIGDQSILVTRNDEGELRAFHNTCRHRGSVLCSKARGRFTAGRIVCPYHAWTYSLDGTLTNTPWRLHSGHFDESAYSLYEVGVAEWAGFLFLNLQPDSSEQFEEAITDWSESLSGWQFETAGTGHRRQWEIACNWKVFWENFSECYHCPGIHPELSQISREFAKGIIRASDHPDWDAGGGTESVYQSRLLPGVHTWSDDGLTNLPYFPGLNEDERRLGHNFSVLRPSGFVAAHVDFARFGYVVPLGPEKVRFTIEWLFPRETLDDPTIDLSAPIEFIERLTAQDARVCELNQRGLHARRHQYGVLVGQEYLLSGFHAWVKSKLSE